MNPITTYLENYGLTLSDPCKKALMNYTIKRFEKGQYFLTEKQKAKYLGFIIKGKIIQYYNIDGKHVTRWVSLQHNFVEKRSSLSQSQSHSKALQPKGLVPITNTRGSYLTLIIKFEVL